MNGQTESEQGDMTRNLSIQKHMGKFRIDWSRPISITFSKYEDVEYLLTYKRYLPRGVYLDKEYYEEIEKRRKLLHPIMCCAKNHDDFKKKYQMEEDTLIIQGKHYTVNNLHQLPAEINGFEASTKKGDGVTCFFAELNPISNFHPVKLEHDGHIYHSSEQLIQHKKKPVVWGQNCRGSNSINNYSHEMQKWGEEHKALWPTNLGRFCQITMLWWH